MKKKTTKLRLHPAAMQRKITELSRSPSKRSCLNGTCRRSLNVGSTQKEQFSGCQLDHFRNERSRKCQPEMHEASIVQTTKRERMKLREKMNNKKLCANSSGGGRDLQWISCFQRGND